jgi:hypothetical protein
VWKPEGRKIHTGVDAKIRLNRIQYSIQPYSIQSLRKARNGFMYTESLWAVVHKLIDLRGPLKAWNILAGCRSVNF